MTTFRTFLTSRYGSTADTLLDASAKPTRSYKDVLRDRSERQRVDGSGPVWPLRSADLPSRDMAA